MVCNCVYSGVAYWPVALFSSLLTTLGRGIATICGRKQVTRSPTSLIPHAGST